jgi:hypothetical protein
MHKFVRYAVIAAVILLGLIAVISTQSNQVIAAGGGAGMVAAMSESATQVVGGDEASLRELLGRLVGRSPYPDQKSVIYVGQLPDQLPFELPLPDGARTIGSISYGTPGYTQIMVDTPQSPSDVVQFFRDSLKPDQWQVIENALTNEPVFVSEPSASANFCYQETLGTLNVKAQAEDDITHVVLMLFTNAPGEGISCKSSGQAPEVGAPYTLLPQLTTPDGVEIRPSGGAGGIADVIGYRSAVIGASLSSELSLQAIADAYNQQLKAAGWMMSGSESGDHLSWSGWTLKDTQGKTWAGTFLLIANSVIENLYIAQVTVQEIPPDTK